MKEEDKEKSNLKKVLYLGSDIGFFNSLKEKFSETYTLDIKFLINEAKTDKDIQSLINKVSNNPPKIVLVDFSQNSKGMLHLTRVSLRQNHTKRIKFIGLTDYSADKEVLKNAILTNMSSVHVKSSEFESIIYNLMILSFPESIKEHGFATGELADEISAYFPCRASIINEGFITIESNISMSPNQKINLLTHWSNKKIIGSSLATLEEQSNTNLYYNYNFSQKLALDHVNPIIRSDDMTEEEYEEKITHNNELLENSKYRFKKWATDNKDRSHPKFLKAFVVDKKGLLFEDQPLSDSYSFVFRSQPYIQSPEKEILRIMPQLIVFNVEDVDKKVVEDNPDIAFMYNTTKMLQVLIQTLRKLNLEPVPVVIVFNAGEHDSAYYQKVLNYPSILAVKEEMKIEMVLKMSEMLKSKIVKSLPELSKNDIYISKNSPYTYAEIETSITLIACSETDVFFNSPQTLPVGRILRISLPVPMYISIVPMLEKTKIQSDYYAVIHGIGEEERKELRRYINDVFFREHDSEKEKEIEEVNALKEKFLADKNKEALEQAAKKKESEELDAKAEDIISELGNENDTD